MYKLFLLISFFIILPYSLACSSPGRPAIALYNDDALVCSTSSHSDLENFCDFKISQEERLYLENQVEQHLNNQFIGSIIINKETDQSYQEFMKEFENTNNDKCDCIDYLNLERNLGWTVYTKKNDCSLTSDCRWVPPKGCIGRIWHWYIFPSLPLILVFSVFIVIIIILVARKKENNI